MTTGKNHSKRPLSVLLSLLFFSTVPLSQASADGLYQFVVPVSVTNIPETVNKARVKCIAGNYTHLLSRDLSENPPTSRSGGPSRDDPAWEPLSAQVLVSGYSEFDIPSNRQIDQEMTVHANYKSGSIDEGYELINYRCALQLRSGSNSWCVPTVEASSSACRLDAAHPAEIQATGNMPARFPGF
jgi:hypothetical protein